MSDKGCFYSLHSSSCFTEGRKYCIKAQSCCFRQQYACKLLESDTPSSSRFCVGLVALAAIKNSGSPLCMEVFKWSLLGGSDSALVVTCSWVSNGCTEILSDVVLFVLRRGWCISGVTIKLWIFIPWAVIMSWSPCRAAKISPRSAPG